MSIDRTSETIAHFSGLFENTLEEARLRQEYTDFKFVKKSEADDARFEFAPPLIKSGYDIGDYDPGVRYVAQNSVKLSEPARALPEATALAATPLAPNYVPPFFPEPSENGIDGLNATQLPFVPIPSSVATMTLQSILLRDNDTYGHVDQAGFLSTALFHEQIASVVTLAEALAPWSSDTLAQEILSDPSAVHNFREDLEAVIPNADAVALASIATDEAVLAIHVDGTKVEEMPELEALLPAYIRAKRDAETEKAELEEAHQLAGHSKGGEGLFESLDGLVETYAMSGHNVTTGANEALNSVSIHTSWIDAATIVVGGDYVGLNAVSQINLLSDRNYVDGQRQNDAISEAYNIAAVSEDAADAAQNAIPGLPQTWSTVHFKGDVTVTNLIKQYTFATDIDQVQLTLTANSTGIVTGENQTFNLATAAEAGFGYDLIFVGGSMVSANILNQTNVLLDDDYFYGAGMSHAAISEGDNLLLNKAEIHKQGVDTQVEMIQEFKDALRDLGNSAADLMASVASNALFEGLQALKILKIDGTLTQLNVVDQINYVGDQDQVLMALDAMQSAIDNVPVAITTGSNLLSNEAIIKTSGLDSNIMAGGGYYNDALLYQAELIDTDADPLGVSITDLANEAVAFLVDDMIAKSISENMEAAGFSSDADAGGYTLDIMQTMTA